MACNFLRRLALQGKKKLDDVPRLDVVEIARVPDMLPSLFPSLSGLMYRGADKSLSPTRKETI